MEELEKLFKKFVKKTLNLKDEEIDKMLYLDDEHTKINPKAADALLAKDKERIGGIKEETETTAQEKFDEGYSKAKGEIMTDFERKIKEKFGVDFKKKGLELVDELITAKVSAAGKGGEELLEEKVKAHPAYIKLHTDLHTQLEALKTENEKKFKEFEKGYTEKETTGKVLKKALDLFISLKPILSEDARKAENQKELFLGQLKGNKYKFSEDGETIIVLDDKGKPKEDGHGNRVKFEDLVKEQATSLFDFKAADDRSSSGGGAAGSGGSGGAGGAGDAAKKWTGAIPKDQNEYLKMASELEQKGDKEGLQKLTEATKEVGVLFSKT